MFDVLANKRALYKKKRLLKKSLLKYEVSLLFRIFAEIPASTSAVLKLSLAFDPRASTVSE